MAKITLGGAPVETSGRLPEIGTKALDFKLTSTDLSIKTLEDFKGDYLILNVFPSVDTGVCAQSVRHFNEKANGLENTKVLCISRDLPFAQNRFCGAENLNNVISLSDFKDGSFGKAYGLDFVGGAFDGLHSRCVVVIDPKGTIVHTEQVNEVGEEPNYNAAFSAITNA